MRELDDAQSPAEGLGRCAAGKDVDGTFLSVVLEIDFRATMSKGCALRLSMPARERRALQKTINVESDESARAAMHELLAELREAGS